MLPNRWLPKLIGVATLVGALAAPAAPAALADHASRGASPVFVLGQSEPIAGAWSKLARSDDGVAMRLHTRDLHPGWAYTVWWLIFNHPDRCTQGMDGSRCGMGDLMDPATGPSVQYATGRLIGGGGVGNFSAALAAGDTGGCTPAAVGLPCSGLLNPRGAAILLVVRSHGPAIPGQLAEQTGSFNGGCPPNTCENVQLSPQDS